jgi:hypothetical protein
MLDSVLPPLLEWETFYVITGSAAAALLSIPRQFLWRGPELALVLVAVASLLLPFIGIRNAWDAAVWIAAKRR